MKFPSIKDVAHDLRVENRTLDPADFPLDNGHGESESCDVRLQVYPDGQWAIRIGDSSYDLDHRGFWGSSSLDGRRFDSRAMAKDLIDQCKDHYAQTEEAYAAITHLTEGK